MKDFFFLVRHGRYDFNSMELTKEGREIDAPKAFKELRARGISKGAIVLSSTAIRAVQTAEIVSVGISGNLVTSELINQGGNNVEGVKDLDEFVGRALKIAGVDIRRQSGLVVVTHAPMVGAAIGLHRFSANRVEYGQVVEYHRGMWQNPYFRPLAEI